MIATWWADLSPVMKLLWGVTLTATLIFVIQTVMTFLGADADSTDFDVDVDTSMDGSDLSNIDSGANLYTFRNFVNFFLGFGWTAIILQPSVKSTAVLVIISVLVGIALVALVMYMFKWLYSMQQSGNINVYKSDNAVTDGDEIKTGASVKVLEAVDGNTLLVEELNSYII